MPGNTNFQLLERLLSLRALDTFFFGTAITYTSLSLVNGLCPHTMHFILFIFYLNFYFRTEFDQYDDGSSLIIIHVVLVIFHLADYFKK